MKINKEQRGEETEKWGIKWKKGKKKRNEREKGGKRRRKRKKGKNKKWSKIAV